MSEPLPERFCTYCASSLIPLEVPHTSATCVTCGKMKYDVRLGEGGKGIKIEAGESFTIPSSWLTISFDPQKSRGKLYRSGVPFLLQQLFLSWAPGKPEDFVATVKTARDAWEAELQGSDKLAGIDFQAPDASEKVWERLKDDRESWDFTRSASACRP